MHYGVPESFVGTWTGTGSDTAGTAKGKAFDIKITLSSDTIIGQVQYGAVGSGCSGTLIEDSSASNTDSQVSFRETLTNTSQTKCPIVSYVTLKQSGSSSSSYSLFNTSTDTNPLSTGNLTKQ
jgi:hypothetical protein